MSNLFTGSTRGFLASKLRKHINGTSFDYGNVLQINETQHFENLFHFAGPSDRDDFKNSRKVVETIVNGTINMLDIAMRHHSKFIFASTLGVEAPDNTYCYSKLLMEKYIESMYDNYIILRIPRVYSKCRTKGLMKQIRENTISKADMNKSVSYITLNDFIEQTLTALKHTKTTFNYNITNHRTIREIKQWVEK